MCVCVGGSLYFARSLSEAPGLSARLAGGVEHTKGVWATSLHSPSRSTVTGPDASATVSDTTHVRPSVTDEKELEAMTGSTFVRSTGGAAPGVGGATAGGGKEKAIVYRECAALVISLVCSERSCIPRRAAFTCNNGGSIVNNKWSVQKKVRGNCSENTRE